MEAGFQEKTQVSMRANPNCPNATATIGKRLQFAAKSEAFAGAEQRSLLDETLDEDLEAVNMELAGLNPPAIDAPQTDKPRRQALPAHLPRTLVWTLLIVLPDTHPQTD